MAKVPRMSLADKLHRGFVCTCMGISLLGALGICLKGYEYVIYVRPIRKAEEARLEQELLREGQGL